MSSIFRDPHTPTFAPASPGEKAKPHAAGSATADKKASPLAPEGDGVDAFPPTPAATQPALTKNMPTPPAPGRAKLSVDTQHLPVYRTESARPAERSASPQADALRAVRSDPTGVPLKAAKKPTDYQEHFYDLGSLIVHPSHGATARSLAKIIERKEGLKIYLYEPTPGNLYAISHAASELSLPDGKSTQHRELQKALLLSGWGRGVGRFAVDDPAQLASNKMHAAKVFLKPADPTQHGGLRLQKHEGRYVVDVSSSFSFHGASDASMDHIARFYATVLRFSEDPPESVSVIPAEASCHKTACIEAAPHLLDLVRRINAQLDE